jgi:hypothetical protein
MAIEGEFKYKYKYICPLKKITPTYNAASGFFENIILTIKTSILTTMERERSEFYY